jgi:methylated-DNA-[protein]-cysteine S-methyltransferase
LQVPNCNKFRTHTGWQPEIPFGKTISYKTLAIKLKRVNAFRAVGAANGKNPLPIIVPCHRVISADGTLRGYSGGLELKTKLLDLEQNQNKLSQLFI